MTLNDLNTEPQAPAMEPVEELTYGPDTDLEDGAHEATLAGIERFTWEDRPLLRWRFAVDTDDGPVEVEGVSSESPSLKSKGAQWAAALLGQGAVRPGAGLKVRDLIGHACIVTTEHNEQSGFPKVVAVSAMPKGRK